MRRLRTREIIHNSRLTLIVVESIEFRHGETDTGCHVQGNIEPIAVVVCSPKGMYAVDMQAAPADIDQFKQDVPELDAKVSPWN